MGVQLVIAARATKWLLPLLMLAAAVSWSSRGFCATQIVVDWNDNEDAASDFHFDRVPRPMRRDAAENASFSIIDGRLDPNSGGTDRLHDGAVPRHEDRPGDNFFFDAGTDGGRLLIDLGKVVEVRQVNSFSWHNSARGPQVYELYGSAGTGPAFHAKPGRGTDPVTCGWLRIGKVDARSGEHPPGGQYGVSISDSAGKLGAFRYLLFDIFRTENSDPFGNTFFSEIDVLDSNSPPSAEASLESACRTTVQTEGYEVVVDTCETPDLTEWAAKKVVPMVREWYPRLVNLLPSSGFQPPKRVIISFSKNMQGVADTGGRRIRCAADWFRSNLEGEALGAIFHELVHVVQRYGHNPAAGRQNVPTPGWLTEGIADYLRWFSFEPQAHGAEISAENADRVKYDAGYRPTANFLNWVAQKYDPGLIQALNAALRDGTYRETFWQERTGRVLADLAKDWRESLRHGQVAPIGK